MVKKTNQIKHPTKNELGVILSLYRQKRYKECLAEVKDRLKFFPNSADLLNFEGMAYTALNKDDEAVLSYQKVIKADPSHAGAYYNMGIVFKRNGRIKEAIEKYKKAIFLNPTYVQAHNNLGVIYKNEGDYEKAIELFTRVVELKPDHHNAHFNLGLMYNETGIKYKNQKDYEKAIYYFDLVTDVLPTNPEAFYNLGNVYFETNELELSEDKFKKAISIRPDYVEAWSNLGILYHRIGKLKKAIKHYGKALDIDPKHSESYYNAAISYKEIGDRDTAAKYYLNCLDLDPNMVSASVNLAILYQEFGKYSAALSLMREAVKKNEYHLEGRHSYSLLLLKNGHFKEGWENYEYRWKVPPGNRVKWPIKDKPIWKGEERKHVALWREQGIGDDVIFLGLIPEVRDMCASLSVYVDRRLIPLCERSMPDISFFPDEDSLKKVAYDYHLPMGSVPGLIRNDISDFDKTVRGYLQADEARVKSIRSELGVEGKKVIGISWKSFSPQNKSRKSIELSDFRNVFVDLDIVLVNLQYGDVDQEIREFKEETGIEVLQCSSIDNKEDIDGLAALIEVCDLVVSTSNVTIHLAGALGKETWVLLPFVSNYWWLLDRKDSIWYPSLSLYRQAQLNDWNEVFRSVQRDLKARFVSQGI